MMMMVVVVVMMVMSMRDNNYSERASSMPSGTGRRGHRPTKSRVCGWQWRTSSAGGDLRRSGRRPSWPGRSRSRRSFQRGCSGCSGAELSWSGAPGGPGGPTAWAPFRGTSSSWSAGRCRWPWTGSVGSSANRSTPCCGSSTPRSAGHTVPKFFLGFQGPSSLSIQQSQAGVNYSDYLPF